uniref:Olfactory receptor n=1 Tax=Leptobrachium leishanense TaxID=445787 RepID=A0A8C5P981_9ANUR
MPIGYNSSFAMPPTFLLIGIPGLQGGTFWLSIIFCAIYILSVMGNCAVFYIIKTEKSLQGPMYFFLSMLAVNDVVMPSSIVPKMMGIFWFGAGQIDAPSCLAQMFFVNSFCAVTSGVLTAMAYDRYVAICFPLRYVSVFTNALLVKLVAAIVVRAIVIILPIPLMVLRLRFCTNTVISHSYCDHMAVVNLSCSDTHINNIYGIVAVLCTMVTDLTLIGLSYAMILREVYKLSSTHARHKALGTCGSHVCVIIVAYFPLAFSAITYRIGQNRIPQSVHVFFADVYIILTVFLDPLIYGLKTKQIRERNFSTFWR